MNMTQMPPQEAIESISALTSRMVKLTDDLQREAAGVQAQWRGLKNAGGKCDEYAIALLRKLLPALDSIEQFSVRTSTKIRQMEVEKNPNY